MSYNLKENPVSPIPVIALTIKGDYVGEYTSISDAAFKLGVTPVQITDNLSGKTLRAGIYMFIKKDKYNSNLKYSYAANKRKKKFLNSKII